MDNTISIEQKLEEERKETIFNEYSRKGLLNICKDFDDDTDCMLTNYVSEKAEDGFIYEAVKPIELFIEDIDENKEEFIDKTKEKISQKIDNVADAIDLVFENILSVGNNDK